MQLEWRFSTGLTSERGASDFLNKPVNFRSAQGTATPDCRPLRTDRKRQRLRLTSDQPVCAAASANVCFLVARIIPRRGYERRLWVD